MDLPGWAGSVLGSIRQVVGAGVQIADRQTGGIVGRICRRLGIEDWFPSTDPSQIELQIGEVARGKPASVPEVVARLDVIFELAKTSPRGEDDGIAAFTSLYRTITANVLRWLQEGKFADSEYLARLDIEFAERYLQALRSYAFDRAATPLCWRVLFDNRSVRRISPLHYAAAGVNAHINFDLAFATISTCIGLGVEFGAGEQYEAYLGVNDIFAANTLELRDRFEAEYDPAQVDAVEKLFDDLAIVAGREIAWKEAERIWPHRLDDDRMAEETRSMDLRAAVLGKGMLANPFLQ
ncbi:MAG TPA: DUF5995 family protein [Pseudonocardiaceae bacterium]|nr:DUF5995 family protein [Pseudonocardiaceae bacterium]